MRSHYAPGLPGLLTKDIGAPPSEGTTGRRVVQSNRLIGRDTMQDVLHHIPDMPECINKIGVFVTLGLEQRGGNEPHQ